MIPQTAILSIRGGESCVVPVGDNLFRTLRGAHVFVPTICGGNGFCGQCRVKVLRGAEDAPTDKERKALDHSDADSVALYPLAIPLLLGPGAITTMIVLGQGAYSDGKELAFALGLLAFLAVLSVSMLAAPWIGRHLSARSTAITQRLMGMILAAIAMNMMVSALRASFPGLLK